MMTYTTSRSTLKHLYTRVGPLVAVTLLAAIVLACTSRYRLDLYLNHGQERTKVKVEQTQYVPGTRLADPYADDKIVSGDGSTAALNIGYRGKELVGLRHFGIGFNEYVRYRVYLQLAAVPEPDTIQLVGNSLIQMMGRFELPSETKLFFPAAGTCTVDSVASDNIFATIDGRFKNIDDVSLTIDGRFKVKIAY